MTITVFVLDDHEMVRRGLRDILAAEDDIDVIGEAGTRRLRDFLNECEQRDYGDVVILGLVAWVVRVLNNGTGWWARTCVGLVSV